MKHAAIFLIGLIMGLLLGGIFAKPRVVTTTEYVVTTVHDTITITRPVAIAVPETIRIETATLPCGDGYDSAQVRVPITSVLYTGEGYRARVSGFRPSLDSLIFDRPTITRTPKPKRWAVGVQAGVAATPKGVQPFIGVGVTYKLFEF